MKALDLAALLVLAACASAPEVAPPPLRLSPAAFGGTASAAQRLTFERLEVPAEPIPAPANVQVVDALLEIDPAQVRIAILAFEQKILALEWDGHDLRVERRTRMSAEADPERVLRDLQIAYWPADAVRTGLAKGWELVEAVGARTLLFGGRPAFIVRREAPASWDGRVEIENRLEKYRVTIVSSSRALQ